MEFINISMTGSFDSKILELTDRFREARAGEQFTLRLYDTGTVNVDAVLAFHDIMRSRPKGLSVHIHSFICLVGGEVLVWLAGDTRTLRSDAWIHFREYPRHWLERSEVEKLQDMLDKRDLQLSKTAFQENYLQIERLVKKRLPEHLLNRRVWAGELAEWDIVKPAVVTAKAVEAVSTVKEELGASAPVEARIKAEITKGEN